MLTRRRSTSHALATGNNFILIVRRRSLRCGRRAFLFSVFFFFFFSSSPSGSSTLFQNELEIIHKYRQQIHACNERRVYLKFLQGDRLPAIGLMAVAEMPTSSSAAAAPQNDYDPDWQSFRAAHFGHNPITQLNFHQIRTSETTTTMTVAMRGHLD